MSQSAVMHPLRSAPCWLGVLAIIACSSATSNPSQGAGGAPAAGGAGQVGAGGSNLDITPEACPDAGTPSDAVVCTPVQARDFTRDIVPLFNSCAGEVCHSFSAGAIVEQVGKPSVECCGERLMIEPGHPERSYVLQKLRGTELCGGERMPLERAPFNATDLQTIADWICQGASTNP